MIKLALSQYGLHESNPQTKKYFEAVGMTDLWLQGHTPSCAAYVGWVLKTAGYPYLKTLRSRDYETLFEEPYAPIIGDICVFWRGSIKSLYGHVGFYITGDKDNIWVLGANQKNTVCIGKYPQERLITIRRPEK